MPVTVSPYPASMYVVAAITGCWRYESGINPGIWESLVDMTQIYGEDGWSYIYGTDGSNKGGFGLGQWTNTTDGMRLESLHNFVNLYGYGDGDGDGQLAFFVSEGVWYNKAATQGDYETLDEFLETTSSDLEILVHDFQINWEGVASHFQDRYEYAQDNLEYMMAHMNDDLSLLTWTSGNYYISQQDMYDNLMLCWAYLGDGNAPSPSHKRRKHRLPIWMYF